tara:strand:+ start:233 stop:1252 length:1020 start_codon:yes stop_codon:yes gene_type:complete
VFVKITLYFLLIFSFNILNAQEVNIFTSRHYDSDIQLYKRFTKITGINVNIISGKAKALEQRLIEEGKDSKADLLIVADVGGLYNFEKKGLLQKIESKILKKNVPAHLRNSYWYGITKRSRILFYNPKLIKLKDLENVNYENLSEKKWKKKILVRKSDNVYNQSLVASLIENNGTKFTEQWVQGLVNNMARKPKGNDRAQLLALASGEGSIAIANTYYYALMISGKKGEEQKKAAQKIRPFFPNQTNRGTHINISGAAILKHSKNKNNAVKLLEFLTTDFAQQHIVNSTYEYSILNNVEPNQIVKKMTGIIIEDTTTDVRSFGKLQSKALEIMLKNGWD